MSSDDARMPNPTPRTEDGEAARTELRSAVGELLGDARDMLLIALPVVLGAVIGYLVAGVTGLFVGAGVGLLLVGLYLLWGAVGLVMDFVRWIRSKRSG